MRQYKIIPVIFICVVFLVMNGCKYDGPTAVYKQKHTWREPPVITQLMPDKQALPGVNYITIQGSDFSQDSTDDKVYVNNYEAEVVKHSLTSIVIRRPNVSGDSTAVKVNTFGALELSTYKPYKISPVAPTFGGFISPSELCALLIDKNENLFLVENNSAHEIHKITPEGEKTVIGNANLPVNDAALAPNGNIMLFEKKKEIYFLDVVHGVDTVSVWASAGKNVTKGCFDQYGNLYTAGLKGSGLFVVKPDLSNRVLTIYTKDEILVIREHNNYLYILVNLATFDESNPQLAIWRHAILDGDGNLGDRELVLDWATTGDFKNSTPKSFTISDDDKIYVGTDAANPVLFFDPANGRMDILYKNIIPTSAEKLLWGNGHFMYMVLGRTSWNLYRIDLGQVEDRDLGK